MVGPRRVPLFNFSLHPAHVSEQRRITKLKTLYLFCHLNCETPKERNVGVKVVMS